MKECKARCVERWRSLRAFLFEHHHKKMQKKYFVCYSSKDKKKLEIWERTEKLRQRISSRGRPGISLSTSYRCACNRKVWESEGQGHSNQWTRRTQYTSTLNLRLGEKWRYYYSIYHSHYRLVTEIQFTTVMCETIIFSVMCLLFKKTVLSCGTYINDKKWQKRIHRLKNWNKSEACRNKAVTNLSRE